MRAYARSLPHHRLPEKRRLYCILKNARPGPSEARPASLERVQLFQRPGGKLARRP